MLSPINLIGRNYAPASCDYHPVAFIARRATDVPSCCSERVSASSRCSRVRALGSKVPGVDIRKHRADHADIALFDHSRNHDGKGQAPA